MNPRENLLDSVVRRLLRDVPDEFCYEGCCCANCDAWRALSHPRDPSRVELERSILDDRDAYENWRKEALRSRTEIRRLRKLLNEASGLLADARAWDDITYAWGDARTKLIGRIVEKVDR